MFFSLIKIQGVIGTIPNGTKPVVAVFDTGVWEDHPNLSSFVLRDLSKWMKAGNSSLFAVCFFKMISKLK